MLMKHQETKRKKKEVSYGRLEKEVEKNNEVQKEVTDWASELQSKKVRNEERDKYIETKEKGVGWHIAKIPAEM